MKPASRVNEETSAALCHLHAPLLFSLVLLHHSRTILLNLTHIFLPVSKTMFVEGYDHVYRLNIKHVIEMC